MNPLLKKHYDLQQQIASLEAEENDRRRLIELCVVKFLLQSGKGQPIGTPEGNEPTRQTKIQDTNEKLHELERRISVLKQQIATKDTVHEAKEEQLKETISELRKELDELKKVKLKLGKSTLLSPPTSSRDTHAIPDVSDTSLFSPNEKKSVFSKSLFSPVLSRPNVLKSKQPPSLSNKTQALKDNLSKEQRKTGEERSSVFSTPNSSFNTASRKRLHSPDANEADNIEANLTSLGNISLTTSDGEDTFQSASNSIHGRVSLPAKKKKRVQLMSSEALKVSLDMHGKLLHLDEEDMNPLDHYHDDNFQDDTHSSPLKETRKTTQLPESQPKTKHVFKI